MLVGPPVTSVVSIQSAPAIPHSAGRRAWRGWLVGACAVVAASAILFLLPGRAEIAPRVQADYCYTFLAADRLYEGFGPTSTHPHAPFQKWEWFGDWTFLTQWPVGYPALLCVVRGVMRCGTVAAGQSIAIVSIALALVAWFAWARRVLPSGPVSWLLAAVAACSAVSVEALINPATDTVVVALVPVTLLLAQTALDRKAGPSPDLLFCTGVLAGLLFWFRYAAIYVPAAIGLVLLIGWLRRRVGFRDVAAFAAASLIPVVSLLVLNRACATAVPLQEQFNLGTALRPDFDPTILATAWWNFTGLPFYNYLSFSRWVLAAGVPMGVLLFVLLRRSWRAASWAFVRRSPYGLSASTALVLLTMLIVATMLFRAKYDYANLERYYTAARPLYLLLFVGPLLALPSRAVRGLACVPLLLCLSWYVQVEWPRPYQRWLAAERPRTDYGRWARCFEPRSPGLYRWLRETAAPGLMVVSNHPDEIALETWVPACPLPQDEAQLHRWAARMCEARGVDDLRILFVLDPSNHTRDYYLPPPERVVHDFRLVPYAAAPASIRGYVFEYRLPNRLSCRYDTARALTCPETDHELGPLAERNRHCAPGRAGAAHHCPRQNHGSAEVPPAGQADHPLHGL